MSIDKAGRLRTIYDFVTTTDVIGVEWNQNTDEWRRIDEYGNILELTTEDFDRHPVWGGMKRCLLDVDGTVIAYGSNPRGDGITLYMLNFDGGQNEPAIGDIVTGAASADYAEIVNYVVDSGTWGGNDAAGTLYLRVEGAAPTFQDDEQLDNTTQANILADGGAALGADGVIYGGPQGYRVMVEIPKFYVKSMLSAANIYRWWLSPVPKVGFVVHPDFVQRGGIERDYIYLAAYKASFIYNGDDEAYNAAHEELDSRTGKQPYSGSSNCIWEVQFDGGQNEPNIGDDVGTATDDNFFIVDYVLTGGAWDGSGTGYLWLRKPGDDTCGWVDNEQINNNTLGNILADAGAGLGVNGAPVGRNVTIGHCRTLAGNIGARWGLKGYWTNELLKLLCYIEYANPNSQTQIGRGIVDKAAGTGFAGELTGHDSADTNIGVNGTGSGTGTDGLTPISYRGIENLWGNVWEYVDGFNAVDAEYRLINRDGSGVFADALAAGDYEVSIAVPITSDGYISNIEFEDLLKFAFIPKAVGGSSTSGLCDYFGAHDTGEANIFLSSGFWSDGATAGVADLNLADVAASSGRTFGARIEFI